MMLKSTVRALAVGVVLASGSVYAYEQGDIIARVGAAAADPRENSSDLALNDRSLKTVLGIDSSAGVDSNTQVGLTFTYMLSNDVGVELLAATPFSHNITANLAGATIDAAKVKHLPPTLSLQYFPMGTDSSFKPYVGLGLNYTIFFDESVDSELDAVTTTLGLGNAQDLKLDDSFGLAFEVGCDFAISDTLVLNASVWKADIDTTATFKYAGGNKITADVSIDPMVYMLAVGYKF